MISETVLSFMLMFSSSPALPAQYGPCIPDDEQPASDYWDYGDGVYFDVVAITFPEERCCDSFVMELDYRAAAVGETFYIMRKCDDGSPVGYANGSGITIGGDPDNPVGGTIWVRADIDPDGSMVPDCGMCCTFFLSHGQYQQNGSTVLPDTNMKLCCSMETCEHN